MKTTLNANVYLHFFLVLINSTNRSIVSLESGLISSSLLLVLLFKLTKN
jgi:hypothetical protein